jgi:hypothetical protein
VDDFVSSPPTQQKTKTRRRGHLALDQATLTQLVCIIYAKSFREHGTLVNVVGIHYLMQLFASIRTFVNKFVFSLSNAVVREHQDFVSRSYFSQSDAVVLERQDLD